MMNELHAKSAGASGEYSIAPSRQLAAILIVGHCVVATLVLISDIALAWRVAIFAVLAASLIYELRTTALRLSANAVVALRIAVDNMFSARTRRGEWRDCEVLGSTYVTSVLTVLNLRVAGERRMRSVVLMPDSMAADDFRRLRMWLRWRPQPKTD